ncbi:hypothetical protein WJX79_001192 [Trebouxia sp. C0005]
MAGISKALEFPAEVVFQRVCNSVEAAALLQLSATAQRVEMISRFLLQQQQVPQAHHELQSQLNHALQQLFQLSYTLQAHAEQNSTHSQQLQLQAGVTSKVAERLMLAHCEQELAQRARIVSETRATVRLPPFAQVMQQISDHAYSMECCSPQCSDLEQMKSPACQAERHPLCQGASKAHLHDASQPSTSSLKRVPETPDSSENRSQPTQSPCRHERSGSSPRQAGPLRVVLVNNSDEQAGTQGVNVAAFLLMDSQKGSTSPGHPKSAEPLSVLSQAREGAAAHQQADDSQGQPGGLRLDLSSEEDLLLCTQRIPSSQGGSGSGQGLFKTPDDLPPDPKAQAPALVAPHGTLGMLSPWNTPALAQQAPPHPPDSTQHWKLAGSVSPVAGHPAPPLSWMGSHDAGPATGAASKDKSDGNSNKRKRSVSETNVSLANAAAEIQTNVQPCQ